MKNERKIRKYKINGFSNKERSDILEMLPILIDWKNIMINLFLIVIMHSNYSKMNELIFEF
jgi:hypothetical protein